MEVSAQNPAATQIVNPYDADKAVKERDAEKNAIKVRDTEEDGKVEERKTSSELETKSTDDTSQRAQVEVESIDEVYAKDKETEAINKISIYA